MTKETRRVSIRTAMSVVAVLFVVGAASFDAAGSDRRPNILLIVSEDNGPAMGCYGEPHVQTPTLDRLAAEGVRFERAYVTQAGCSQSRASFLTGLYPHQNGQIGLATWGFQMYREDTPNVVRSLNEAGYRTGFFKAGAVADGFLAGNGWPARTDQASQGV